MYKTIGMNERPFKGLFLSLIMVFITVGMMGTAYARTDDTITPQCTTSDDRLNLQIKDQDEPWGNGVSSTWTASNMAPGNQYDFTGSFVGLRSSSKGYVDLTCDYSVVEERPCAEPDTGPFTNLHPDIMAKELTLTRCIYKTSTWQINCLTGQATGMTAKEERTYRDYPDVRWQIPDINHDGMITFYDLKSGPLKSLPLPQSSKTDATVEIGVKFAESAGNALQGDTFNMAMHCTFK